jgi:tRNA nucleotidyltransferase (CCA-adding enzyme)
VKSELNGKDLLELGLQRGPLFGEVVERLLAARLDGLINSTEEEKNLAKSMIESW